MEVLSEKGLNETMEADFDDFRIEYLSEWEADAKRL
jgi:hypothetical protein